MAMLCDHCIANLNLFSHSHSHVHDHSVASCDAIPQVPTSLTPDAATVPCFIVGAAVGCLLLLSMFLTIATAAINNYTSISKFLYTRHPPPPCSNSSVAPARRRTRPILGIGRVQATIQAYIANCAQVQYLILLIAAHSIVGTRPACY